MPFPLDVVAVVGLVALGLRSPLGRRAINLVQQKVNHLLDRAENPVEALDLSYEKQLQALQQVRRGVADVVTSEKRLGMQAAQLQQTQEKLQAQARVAVQQGKDDLARLALTRAQAAGAQLEPLKQQVAQLQEQEQKLQLTSQKLQARVESFKTQRETLKAQYSAAQASARIGETVTGLSSEAADVNLMLERAQDRTAQMQARAAAIDDLVSSGTLDAIGSSGGDDIDRQLRVTASDAAVDAQLSQLKQEVLGDPTNKPRLGAAEAPEETTTEGGIS